MDRAVVRTKKRGVDIEFKTLEDHSPQDKDKVVGDEKEISTYLNVLANLIDNVEAKLEEYATAVYSADAKSKADKEFVTAEEGDLDRLYEALRSHKKRLVEWNVRYTTVTTAVEPKKKSKGEEQTSKLENGVLELVAIHKDTQKETQKLLASLSDQPKHKGYGDHSVRLPKLDLPSFNGDVLNFTEFWDMFKTSVHCNTSLSDAERMTYLKCSLRGTALDAIKGLTLDDRNYGVAVELLVERFGQTQSIVNAHYVALMELRCATENTKSLRAVHDEIEKHLRALEVNDQYVNQDIFISIILSKLPQSAKFHLEMSKGTTPWTTASLRVALNGYVSAKESADRQSKDQQNRAHTAPSAVQGLVVHSSKPKASSAAKCYFCKGEHFSDECAKYKTIKDRKEQIAGRCYVCFRKDHIASKCKDPWSCFHCKEKTHHRSLCPKKFQHETAMCINDSPTTGDDVNGIKSEPALVFNDHEVCLQTALASVTDGTLMKRQEIRILFDTGSSRSFITTEVKNELGLAVNGAQNLALSVFGDESRKLVGYETVKVHVELPDGSSQALEANVTDNITCPIRRHPLNTQDFPVLETVKLAEALPQYEESASVHLLVGSDFYHSFVGGNHIELSDQLVLVDSKFGYIPSGLIPKHNGSVLVANCGEPEFDIPPPEFDLQCFWAVEQLGIGDDHDKSQHDIVQDKFDATVQFENDRYTVQWPWLEDNTMLPDNHSLAVGRLRSLIKRAQKSKGVLVKYNDIIMDQLEKGIIERVTLENGWGTVSLLTPPLCCQRRQQYN